MSVLNTTGFPAAGVVHVNTEAIWYSGKTSTTFTGLIRGHWNSVNQKHWVEVTENGQDILVYPEVTDQIGLLAGRRAWIYAYGEGDDMQGNGTLIWSGVVLADAEQEDAASWRLQVEGIRRLFDQDLGLDLNQTELRPRGVNYTFGNPLAIELVRFTGDVSHGTIDSRITFMFSGFFETQLAFCQALNARLDTELAAAGWTEQVYASPVGDKWNLLYKTDPATARWVALLAESDVDGETSDELRLNRTGEAVADVGLSLEYRARWVEEKVEGSRTVPRGTIGSTDRYDPHSGSVIVGEDDSHSPIRVYVDASSPIGADIDFAVLKYPEGGTAIPGAELRITAGIDYDAETASLMVPGANYLAYTASNPLVLHLGKTWVADGSVVDFLDAVIDAVPTDINLGATPFVTADEVNLAASADALEYAGESPAVMNRTFDQSQPHKLWDYLREHWKLAGVFPITDINGKLSLAPVKSPAQSLVPSVAISSADILTSGGFPRFRKSTEGRYTALMIENGYSPIEDEFLAGPSILQSITARGRQRSSSVLTISPKSGLAHNLDIGAVGAEIAKQTGIKILDMFGAAYGTIEIPVSLKLFDVRLGDEVMVSSDLIPNWNTGALGISGKVGVVIGRRFELDRGIGMLTVLITGHLSYGYAPSFGITAQSNTAGNTWQLTVVLADPHNIVPWGPVGATAATFLAVGDRVQLQLYNSTSLTTNAGTVAAVAGNVVTVTFDGVVSFIGSQRYVLEYADWTSGISGDQQRFVYVADDNDGTLNSTESPYLYSE
jgi:hypothetical protein